MTKALRFDKNEEGCHVCVSHSPGSHGYPEKRIGGKLYLMHRLVYELRFGPIQEGLQVHHRCENKLCANPQHLELLPVVDHTRETARLRSQRTLTADLAIWEASGRPKSSAEFGRALGVSQGSAWKRLNRIKENPDYADHFC